MRAVLQSQGAGVRHCCHLPVKPTYHAACSKYSGRHNFNQLWVESIGNKK